MTATAATVAGAGSAFANNGNGNGNGNSNSHPVLGGSRNVRSQTAMRLRSVAARTHLQDFIAEQETNGDEAFADKRGSFTKTLPHNELGEVDTVQYSAYLTALASGRNSDFEAIQLAPQGFRKLANPQGAYKFERVGRDSHNTWMRPAPTFLGAETSAEMGELYWKALCRDVPFINFNGDMTIQSAVNDLNAFDATVGPKVGNFVTSDTVFRRETPGDLAGPYVTQLLLKPIPWGPKTIEQVYKPSRAGETS